MNILREKLAVANQGEEELERVQRTVLTRNETRAEADLLFGDYAKDMRTSDRSLLEKLFEQTPAAVTMAPNLQKEASGSKRVELLKLAMALSAGPSGEASWLAQFEGSGLMAQAIALEEQSLQLEQAEIQQRMENDARYQQQSQVDRERWQERDNLSLQKRMLALELAKEQAGLGAQEEQHAEDPAEGAEGEMQEAPPEQAQEQAPVAAPAAVEKTASITPRVDAFFEKLAAPTDAQRRYPELLKVASPPKVPNLKPRVTTETSGATPVRSSLSGGA